MGLADYRDFEHLLGQSRALTDVAEAHGTLAGALCASEEYRFEDWLRELYADGRASDEQAARGLRALFEDTRRSLGAGQMEFDVLLPDDEAPIAERTAALGQWCQGFLYGLGTSAIPDPDRLPAEVGEVVRDITAITQVAVDGNENDETNEQAYNELVEFVRVGAQLLFEELAPYRGPVALQASPGASIH
jgi:yecA family protein